MNTIPIAFAFDNNLVRPACICISSLLMNAKEETFYDIFILHSEKESINQSDINKIPTYFKNCRIQYKAIGDEFDGAFEIRGITTPAYYRLLIPELIPEYDKIIYSDVDMIFRMDLSDLYSLDLDGNYIGAVLGLSITLDKNNAKYTKTIGLNEKKYFQSGFLLINSALIRSHNKCSQFKELSKNKYKYQDQDILNIACEGHILSLPLIYNLTTFALKHAINKSPNLKFHYSEQDIKNSLLFGNVHFNGTKPWNGWCYNQDIWWENYRKSPFYDENFYFSFYERNINAIDNWTFWKRVKHLLRYFRK